MSLHYQKYSDYAGYVDKQREKTIKRHHVLRAGMAKRYNDFLVRFPKFIPYLPKAAVLCLGARYGEEVRAFRKLGFDNSVGIDLEPPKDSRYVSRGDWNNLPWADASFEIIYCNAVDHIYCMPSFLSEISRVLKNCGFLVLEMYIKYDKKSDEDIDKHFTANEGYEAMLWNDETDVIDALKGFNVVKHFPIKRKWSTYILQKYGKGR